MVNTDIQDDIRTDLTTEVFNEIGKTVTLKSKSSPIYNTRGEEINQTFTESSVIIVPYSIIQDDTKREPFGDVEEGAMDAAVPYTTTVNKGDKFTIESEDWIVRAVERNYLPDNVVTIVRLTREQN